MVLKDMNVNEELTTVHMGAALVLFISINIIAGYINRRITARNITWFNTLIQPSFKPPSWLFGPVWTVLYIMIGVSGWRLYIKGMFNGPRLAAYIAQSVLNFSYSQIFFGWHQLFIAVLDTALLWVTIIWAFVEYKVVDELAAYLLVPYFMWGSFALCLQATVWWLNPAPVLQNQRNE